MLFLLAIQIVSCIVNGTLAGDKYPWTLNIRVNGQFQCGGVLLNENTAISVAHCVPVGNDLTTVNMIANQPNLTDNGPDVLIFNVTRIVMHPLFNFPCEGNGHPGGAFMSNDISVWKLNLFSGNRKQIPTPLQLETKKASELVKQEFTIAGWGKTSDNDSVVPDLRETSMPIQSRKECERVFPSFDFENGNMLCGGPLNGGRGFCDGDSGGNS